MKTLKQQSLALKQDADKEPKSADVSNMIMKGGRKFLSTLKQKALRAHNSWFRTLTADKRRYIDAVIQTVDKIHSLMILKILAPLVEKLIDAIGGLKGLFGSLSYGMQTFGLRQVRQISLIAVGWGNKLASQWMYDEDFIRHLTVIDMNDLPMFKVSTKL
jgi:hypothetical protein